MSLSNINLPDINGAYEIGLAVGTDPGLAEGLKLPIFRDQAATDSSVFRSCASWVCTNDAFRNYQLADRNFLVSCIAGLIQTKLIRTRPQGSAAEAPDAATRVCDGDWFFAAQASTATADEAARINIQDALNPENIQKALLCIAATKANFWLINHHTGQGALQGYAKKVAETSMSDVSENRRAEILHMVGHWASTIHLLNLAGIRHLRTTYPFMGAEPEHTLTFAADAMLRFTAMPAGTHRLAVGYEGAKKLLNSRIGMYCPNVQEMTAMKEMRDRVTNRPAMYHVGALYLCGDKANDYSDTEAEAYLGRVGTFVLNFLATTTLAKSPHFAEGKVRGYGDFTVEWDGACKQYKLAQIQAQGEVGRRMIAEVAEMDLERFRAIRAQFFQ